MYTFFFSKPFYFLLLKQILNISRAFAYNVLNAFETPYTDNILD